MCQVCRPESVHEYVLTPHSLYAAVSVGLETQTIIAVLNRLSKVALPREIRDFIVASTSNYGKVGGAHACQHYVEHDTMCLAVFALCTFRSLA